MVKTLKKRFCVPRSSRQILTALLILTASPRSRSILILTTRPPKRLSAKRCEKKRKFVIAEYNSYNIRLGNLSCCTLRLIKINQTSGLFGAYLHSIYSLLGAEAIAIPIPIRTFKWNVALLI